MSTAAKWIKRGTFLGFCYFSYEGLYRGFCMMTFNNMMINEYENKTLKEKQQYIFDKQEALAFNYDYHMEKQEKKQQMDKVREQLLKGVKGSVLETHVGTSRNLKYYSEKVELLGIDYSQIFLELAEFKVPMHIQPEYKCMDVNHMESIKENSYDYVVDTFGLEYNVNPVQGLSEMKRVCKEGGKILMVNTGYRAQEKSGGWKGEWRNWGVRLRNRYSLYHYGRFIDRDWEEIIEKVGGLRVDYWDHTINDSVHVYMLTKE